MKQIQQSELDFIAAQVTSETINRLGNSLHETVAGNEQLVKVSTQYMKCASDKTQGRIFELIETRKFNSAAARAGSTLRAVTTDRLGMPHHEADVFIKSSDGNILRQIQAKSSGKASNLARAVSNKKYNGMDRLVNVEQREKVEELIGKRMNSNGIYAEDYKAASNSIKGQLEYENIKSGGTTYKEAMQATENSEVYAFMKNSSEFISGASSAMVSGALAGAFVSGAATGGISAFNGEFCVKETGKAAANGAARQAVISGVSYGIKYLTSNSPVMSSNVVTAMASSAVNMTELTYSFLKGKISTEEYLEGLGSNAVSCFSGIILSAAGGILFGPIGAAVAGTVGLLAMKQLYKAFITAREDLQLAKEERERAEFLSQILIEQIKEEEKLLTKYFKEYSQTLKELKQVVDLALLDDSFTEEAIVSLATSLNIKFEYETLDEFADFMLSNDTLRF